MAHAERARRIRAWSVRAPSALKRQGGQRSASAIVARPNVEILDTHEHGNGPFDPRAQRHSANPSPSVAQPELGPFPLARSHASNF